MDNEPVTLPVVRREILAAFQCAVLAIGGAVICLGIGCIVGMGCHHVGWMQGFKRAESILSADREANPAGLPYHWHTNVYPRWKFPNAQ